MQHNVEFRIYLFDDKKNLRTIIGFLLTSCRSVGNNTPLETWQRLIHITCQTDTCEDQLTFSQGVFVDESIASTMEGVGGDCSGGSSWAKVLVKGAIGGFQPFGSSAENGISEYFATGLLT